MTSEPRAPTVFVGGSVVSMDARHPAPEVVVVEDDRITAVGDRALADAHPGATRRDLEGRRLVPGFIDAHCHLSLAALQPLWVDAGEVETLEELGRELGAQARRQPSGWLRADNWDETDGGPSFDRHDLDEIAGARPTIVMHNTYHQVVVNSAGLDELGIGREAARADPLIAVDGSGDPTGLLLERSAGRAHSRSLADYSDPDQWADHVERRASSLLRHGVTAVHDAACDPAAEAVYQRLADEGRLPISVLVMPAAHPFLTNGLGDRLDGPPTGSGDEILRVGPVKLFADGGVMPAIDVHVGGHPVVMGYRHPDLSAQLVTATERGFRVGVHAMGNSGVSATLDAFREAARVRPDDDHRFRVEHFGLADREQAVLAARLGAIAVVQPGFVEHVGRNTRGFEPDDATWLPFATIAEAGVTLAGSSDDPCGPVPPLACAHLGMHRHSDGIPFVPQESVALDSWLEAYTRGGAYAGGQEDERGSITPGKVADLVVLDDDEVVETWARGRLVYARA